MIMYHGTIKGYADSIMANGLKPMPSQSFHINNIATPPDSAIYLTADITLARLFAKTRADYSNVNPGEEIEYGWKRRDGQPKLEGVDTTPVIVKLEIPDDELSHWVHDEDSPSYESAIQCYCSVKPEQVKEIIPMEDNL